MATFLIPVGRLQEEKIIALLWLLVDYHILGAKIEVTLDGKHLQVIAPPQIAHEVIGAFIEHEVYK